MGSTHTSEPVPRERGGCRRPRRPGPAGPAGRVVAGRHGRRRGRRAGRPGPRRCRVDAVGHLHPGPGAHPRPGRLDDRHHAEVGHRGQRVHHLRPGARAVRGCADRGEGLLRHDQLRGRRRRPQAAGRLQGRRVQRPAEPDPDPGGDRERLRPGGQLLALRRLRLLGPGQRHRRARRLGDARPRHERAAQRLQRPAAVGPGIARNRSSTTRSTIPRTRRSGPSSRTWHRPRPRWPRSSPA